MVPLKLRWHNDNGDSGVDYFSDRSYMLMTGTGIYPVPPVESLKVERQNALYVSAGIHPVK